MHKIQTFQRIKQKINLNNLIAFLMHPFRLLGYNTLETAGVQPWLIQGIRRRDGVGEDQETTA